MSKIILCFFILPVITFGQSKKVLFIGNSYTSVNNLPAMVQQLSLSLGDSLVIDSNTPGGYTFNAHSTNSTTLSKIGQAGWDFVVLQAQSQEPSFPPSQVAVDTYPYASSLVNAIKQADSCAEPLFYMTWGRENGDQQNGQFYPPISTYEGMSKRLRESYLEMAFNNNGSVSPVGAAWYYIRTHFPQFQLYSGDGSHPSIYGSYLAACVHYASIFRKSPVGSSYLAGISQQDAEIIQEAANLIVLDSLDIWHLGHETTTANFDFIENGLMVSFQNLSSNAGSFEWHFGDGNLSVENAPSHYYLAEGTYLVTLIANGICATDTNNLEITIFGNNIKENEAVKRIIRTAHSYELFFTSEDAKNINLYNLNGKLIRTERCNWYLKIERKEPIIMFIQTGNNKSVLKLW